MTLRLTTYLVLQQMGLDDKQICELLNITDSTVRNYRHRLRYPK
jgi:DNA-binding NarL/FixJ family response regulator